MNLIREMKNLWNIKMTVKTIVVSTLETISKRLGGTTDLGEESRGFKPLHNSNSLYT